MTQGIWPFRNIGLKALSFGLALLLWLVIAGEETVERTLTVPLELLQFPQTLELVAAPPMHVDVRLRGPSGTIARISPSEIVAALDLAGATVGRRLYQLTPEQVRVPFGITPVQVTPATIAMLFEESVSRDVEVVPSIEGAPAPGYVIGSVRSNPSRVEVVGPESLVRQVSEAITETLSVTGATEDVNEDVTIGFVEGALRLKTPQRASVTVEIVPAPPERHLAGLPVRFRGLGSDLAGQAVPPTVNVRVRGHREGLNEMVADEVNAFVDVTGLGAGDYELPVNIDPLTDAGVDLIEPSRVQVSLSRVSN